MPSNLRILQVVASLQGGAAQHVAHLSEALRERGHFVSVTAPCDNPELESRLIEQQIPFYETSLNSSFPLEPIFQLKALLEDDRWSHIHVHGHRAALIARLACLLLRQSPPIIYTVHGYHPPYYPNPYSRLVVNATERVLSRWTNAYICVSESCRNDLLTTVPRAISRCIVIENAIPLPFLSAEERQKKRREIRQAYAIPQDAFVVGTVARLQWQKSVSRLVRAFRILHERYTSMYLLVVGDGPKRKSLETLAESLQVNDRCLFAGHQSKTVDFYAAMDIFVLPSLWEGLPLTILESWAVGTGVAATNVPGSRDTIEDGVTGFLADNSVTGIVDVINRMYHTPNMIPPMLQNARDRLERRFSLSQMIDRTIQVYKKTSEG